MSTALSKMSSTYLLAAFSKCTNLLSGRNFENLTETSQSLEGQALRSPGYSKMHPDGVPKLLWVRGRVEFDTLVGLEPKTVQMVLLADLQMWYFLSHVNLLNII